MIRLPMHASIASDYRVTLGVRPFSPARKARVAYGNRTRRSRTGQSPVLNRPIGNNEAPAGELMVVTTMTRTMAMPRSVQSSSFVQEDR